MRLYVDILPVSADKWANWLGAQFNLIYANVLGACAVKIYQTTAEANESAGQTAN